MRGRVRAGPARAHRQVRWVVHLLVEDVREVDELAAGKAREGLRVREVGPAGPLGVAVPGALGRLPLARQLAVDFLRGGRRRTNSEGDAERRLSSGSSAAAAVAVAEVTEAAAEAKRYGGREAGGMRVRTRQPDGLALGEPGLHEVLHFLVHGVPRKVLAALGHFKLLLLLLVAAGGWGWRGPELHLRRV